MKEKPGPVSVGLVAALRAHALSRPQVPAVVFLDRWGEIASSVSFAELDREARRHASVLIQAGLIGKPILLPAEPRREFLLAFAGCLYAAAIAVPVPRSARPRAAARLARIIADAGIRHGMGAEPLVPLPLLWLSSEPDVAPAMVQAPSPHCPAILQYTSGSTGSPKGVVLTHGNLAANLAMLADAFDAGPDSRMLSWLPLHHDMGLVAQLLLALTTGATLFLMQPLDFVRQPIGWLEAIARHRATISGAPNFAYDRCAAQASKLDPALDLSAWSTAYCGAETVRAATLERFAAAFAPFGFSPMALLPCYGLAEATVYVSGGPSGQGMKIDARPERLGPGAVDCGRVSGTVRIVDPDTGTRLADGSEGEIWVAGPHVSPGYFGEQERGTFGNSLGAEDGFLRTGDLGFMRGDRLFVSGRLKDAILHHGETLHPEDLEATIANAGNLPRGAVFAIQGADEEKVVAVFEVGRRGADNRYLRSLAQAAMLAVAEAHAIRLADILLVPPGQVPLTTSGKVRRAACRALYVRGALTSLLANAGEQEVCASVASVGN